MMKKHAILTSYLLIAISCVTLCSTIATARVLYVDTDATGADNGSSWQDAYNFLQDALAVAIADDEIRVAEGIYYPDANSANPAGTRNREATFQLTSAVTLKGGYAGFGQPDPDARDTELYETTLSGNFAGINSYHVVTIDPQDGPKVLDGFTVTAGKAHGPASEQQDSGGAIYILYAQDPNVQIANCKIINNSANTRAGGIYAAARNIKITNCCFSHNHARNGGAISASAVTLSDCIFTDNSAEYAGALFNSGYAGQIPATLNNCKFFNNTSDRAAQS